MKEQLARQLAQTLEQDVGKSIPITETLNL